MFLPPLLRVLFFALFLCRSAEAADPVRPPRIAFMISESEYDTRTTVPAFAKAELEPRGVSCAFSIAPAEHSSDFPGLDALLPTADLLFVSVRRQAPTEAQMKLIRAHVAAGKPVVGIRTASHAFAPPLGKNPPPAPEGHVYWPEFDHEVLGGNYHDHYGVGIPTLVKIIPEMADHPVLAGIGPEEVRLTSHLYKNPDLPATVTKLMTGRMDGRPEVEPVAWVNTAGGRRVFYTSLGSPQDFESPQFRRLLRNGIFWALRLPTADAVQGQGKTER
jgi:type 1 glutamine amidotransferase